MVAYNGQQEYRPDDEERVDAQLLGIGQNRLNENEPDVPCDHSNTNSSSLHTGRVELGLNYEEQAEHETDAKPSHHHQSDLKDCQRTAFTIAWDLHYQQEKRNHQPYQGHGP